MSERDSQLREIDPDPGVEEEIAADLGVDEEVGVDLGESTRDRTESEESRVGDRLRSLGSRQGLVVSLVLAIGGLLVGGVLPLGILGKWLGIAAGAFLYGLSTDARRYLELALAGAIAGGGSALLGNLTLTFVGVGLPLVAVGLAGGTVAGVLGHYSGRDLRDGLTRDL